MKKFFLIAMFSLALAGCDTDRAAGSHRNDRTNVDTHNASAYESDNTGRNIRDRDERAITPENQSESEADRAITQRIRQALVGDDSLSTNAKNIKIITRNGVVVIRGPILNAQEKEAIERKISQIQGIKQVDNQLEVTGNNH